MLQEKGEGTPHVAALPEEHDSGGTRGRAGGDAQEDCEGAVKKSGEPESSGAQGGDRGMWRKMNVPTESAKELEDTPSEVDGQQQKDCTGW